MDTTELVLSKREYVWIRRLGSLVTSIRNLISCIIEGAVVTRSNCVYLYLEAKRTEKKSHERDQLTFGTIDLCKFFWQAFRMRNVAGFASQKILFRNWHSMSFFSVNIQKLSKSFCLSVSWVKFLKFLKTWKIVSWVIGCLLY